MAWLTLGAAIFPFLVVAFYTHPSADDYWLTNMVIATDAWQAQWDIRQNWSGRYMSMFLGSFNPLVYRAFGAYKLMAFLMFILTYAALLAFVKTFLYRAFPMSMAALLSLLLLVLHVGFMPTVAQGYYWLSGSLSYQTANIFMLFLLATLWHFYQNQNTPKKAFYIFLITILLCINIGLNETNMALLAFLMTAFLLVDTFLHRRLNFTLVYFLIITGICCALVYFAPGNLNRLKEYPDHGNLIFAGAYATAIAVNNSLNWLATTPILPLTVLFIPFSLKLAHYQKYQKNIHPATAIFLFFLSLIICFFVAYWSKGDHAPPRVQNNIYLVFFIGWFLTIHTTVAYLGGKYSLQILPVPIYARWLICLWIGLLLLYSKQSNIRQAYTDLFSGRASHYNQQMNARYTYLQKSDCQVCPIPEIQNIPRTIFFEEIPADTTWKNRYFSEYFGKKLMLLQPDTVSSGKQLK
ncbi:DUF6056 family protein [Adhaeribacter rhizoryzae]|uniref:Glycosyltransferase RgtA/B/C/D-like domain-containing protein n=1 Tax=Adhaeribacter rhizoryzae TaxID=2607907 RepID=A0A5M6DCU0_9BACT|nr:DUF6056 family protein [Adhaeribacter rhizoryzae]KAA5544210.1 hypothetical protein F0145_14985 [Adhaeribacter rhizoryzae]